MTEACQRPCRDCPWRLDAPVGVWPEAAWLRLWATCQDDGMGMMLCHNGPAPATDRPALLCAGWVRVVGVEAIGVRLALMLERISVVTLESQPGDPALYSNFEDLLLAQGIAPPRRNQVRGVPQ